MSENEVSKYYPGLNRLLVVEKEVPQTPCTLISPDSPYSYGEIVGVGSIKDSKDIACDQFNVGDNVYFLSSAGIKMHLPEGTFKLLNVQEIIIGVFKDK